MSLQRYTPVPPIPVKKPDRKNSVKGPPAAAAAAAAGANKAAKQPSSGSTTSAKAQQQPTNRNNKDRTTDVKKANKEQTPPSAAAAAANKVDAKQPKTVASTQASKTAHPVEKSQTMESKPAEDHGENFADEQTDVVLFETNLGGLETSTDAINDAEKEDENAENSSPEYTPRASPTPTPDDGPSSDRKKLKVMTMQHLVELQTFTDDADEAKLINSLLFLHNTMANRSARASVTPLFVTLGFFEFCQQVFSGDKVDLFDPRTTLTLGVALNLTDTSLEACRKLVEIGLEKQLFQMARRDELDPSKTDFGPMQEEVAMFVIGILYNAIQGEPAARELFRDQKALQLLQKFRTDKKDTGSHRKDMVSYLALILQAYVINEDENDLIGSDHEAFKFLAYELKVSVTRNPRRSPNGFKDTEILAALNKLAVNDANKAMIVGSGVLASYVRLLEAADCSVEEQFLATQGLWTLARRCADDVRKQKGCEEAVTNLLEKTDNDDVRRQAMGVLKELNITVEPSSINAPVETFSGSIFISYNHKAQSVVFRIRDHLKTLGLNIWIDSEQIHKGQSLAAAIAEGIDNSSIVLVCISQAYYESPYCQDECTYAHDCKKEIIPLTMEPRYHPHGWLKFLLRDRFRYDFSSVDTFSDSIKRLVDVICKSANIARNGDQPDGLGSSLSPSTGVKSTQRPQSIITRGTQPRDPGSTEGGSHGAPHSSELENTIGAWTVSDVKNWLNENGLHRLHDWFNEFDGKQLVEYRKLKYSFPETFIQQEMERGKLAMTDVMKLNMALKVLF